MDSLRSRLLGTALAAALAAPVWAQEAPAPAAPAAPAESQPAPATPPLVNPAPQAEVGTPPPAAPDAPGAAATPETAGTPAQPAPGAPGAAPGDPAQPEVYEIVKATHGDWQVRCSPEGNECFMYQLALDAEKNPVAEFSLLKLPAGGEAAAGATVVTPLGTLLTSGLVLQTDSGERRQYPFAWCSQVGCFARFGLAGAAIDAMKRGNSTRVTLASVAAPDQPLTLNVSLTGFTAAYDSLEVPTPDAAGAAGQ